MRIIPSLKTGLSGAAALFLLLVLADAGRAEDWPQFRRNPAKSGFSPEAMAGPLNLSWTRALGTSLASPVLWGGNLYIAAGEKLCCLDAATGVTNWEYDLRSLVSATPAVSRGRVYAISRRGELVCLSARTGKVLATLWIGGMHFSSPLVSADGKTLVLGIGIPEREVRAYDAISLQRIWSFPTLQPSYSSAACDADRVVIGANDSTFYCLDLKTGAEKWRRQFPDAEIDLATPCLEGGKVFISMTGNPTIYALSLSSGELLWSVKPEGYVYGQKASSVAAGADRIFTVRHKLVASPPANAVYAMHPETGALLWSAQTPANTGTPGSMPSPCVSGDRLFTCIDNNLQMYQTSSPTPEEIETLDTAIRSSPTPANGKVYAVTQNGILHAFQTANVAPDAPASGFSPDGTIVQQRSVTITWDPAYDPNHDYSGIRYELYWDDDGEVLDDHDGEIVTGYGVPSALIPASGLVPNTTVFYRVRAQDPNGALSPWSLDHSFQYRPPVWSTHEDASSSMPQRFKATPENRGVTLSWTSPNSTRTVSFRLSMKAQGQDGYDIPAELGNRTSCTVGGLVNGVRYDFALSAVANDGKESPAVFASAIPNPQIVVRTAGGGSRLFLSTELRQAAEYAGPGDTIEMVENSYVLDGPLQLTHGVTLKGASPAKTIIDASALDSKPSERGHGAIRIHGGPEDSITALHGFSVLQAPGYAVEIGPSASVEIRNLVLARGGGGIIAQKNASGTVRNLTIADNSGDGILSGATDLNLRNLIFSRNGGVAVKLEAEKNGDGSLKTTYSLFHANAGGTHEGGAESGVGDGSGDPLFANADAGDYHLRGGSCAIDAGDPADDYSQEPAPNGSRIDQGAYGGINEAAASSGSNPGQAAAPGTPSSKAGGAGGGCFISSGRRK